MEGISFEDLFLGGVILTFVLALCFRPPNHTPGFGILSTQPRDFRFSLDEI